MKKSSEPVFEGSESGSTYYHSRSVVESAFDARHEAPIRHVASTEVRPSPALNVQRRRTSCAQTPEDMGLLGVVKSAVVVVDVVVVVLRFEKYLRKCRSSV